MTQCDTCGRDATQCICPVCPECGERGNEYCYDRGTLRYNTVQLVGRALRRIATLEWQLEDELARLRVLEETLDREDARAIDRATQSD